VEGRGWIYARHAPIEPSARRCSFLDARTAGLLALIETPEAVEGYLLPAQEQDDVKRMTQRCITYIQEDAKLAARRGCLSR
jgi:hypothetical protein